jgi:hypothetical protein
LYSRGVVLFYAIMCRYDVLSQVTPE